MSLEQTIEAILFFKGEPVSVCELCELLTLDEDAVREGLSTLQGTLKLRGIRLLDNGTEVELVTSPESHELIERISREALSKELSQAASETLAIILYKCPISRSEIDHIRGVNSTYMLRNLMIRGLIERVPAPTGERSLLYKPTLKLLSHLGITRIEELPEFDKVKRELESFSRHAQSPQPSSEHE